MIFPEPTEHTKVVSKLVDAEFADHPGQTSNFCWATTRESVLEMVDRFFNERFQEFGPYEDAIEILCQNISSDSININEAKYWANRWYIDKAWKSDIDRAINDNSKCQKIIE